MLALWRSSDPESFARAWLARAHPVGTRLTVHAWRRRRSPVRSTGSSLTARCAFAATVTSNSSEPATSSCEPPRAARARQCCLRSMPAIRTSSLRSSTGARSRRAGASRPIRAAPATNMPSGCTSFLSSKAMARTTSSAAIIGTVVPRATHNLQVLVSKYFSVEPLIAGEGKAEWPIALDVDEPQNVGADRALNVMAAHEKFPGDLIVIDFGTATTFDVVDYTGAYKGGIIAPGINLSLDALVNAAAKLPRIAIEVPEDTVRHRPHHRQPDADRHLLGLCRDDGGTGCAPEARDRPAGKGRSPPAASRPCSTRTPTCSMPLNPTLRSRG